LLLFFGFLATGFGFSWYYEGVQAIGPTRAGIFINLVPVLAVLLGWLLLGETLVPIFSYRRMLRSAGGLADQRRHGKRTADIDLRLSARRLEEPQRPAAETLFYGNAPYASHCLVVDDAPSNLAS